ncbi:MAG TPA: DUF4129 domain-containing protein [Sporichthyaceae bacterium]|nr:DUF4129 domain-containing protein [Sporichthyaceae bacterium]
MSIPGDGNVPLVPGREAARAAAHAELSKPLYHAHDPSLWKRAVDRVWAWLGALFDHTAGAGPGGRLTAVLLLALLVLAAVAFRARLGPTRRTAGRRAAVFTEARRRGAVEYHRAANDALASGDLSTAVLERFRALVREAEERALIAPRPGRTADEFAVEVGGLRPDAAPTLTAAAEVFDRVRYGGRVGSVEHHNLVLAAVDALRAAPTTVGTVSR